MKLIPPVLLALVGLVGGLAAGQMLRPVETPGPEPAPEATAAVEPEIPPEALPGAPPPAYEPELEREYAAIDKQFLVPLVKGDAVGALMILSLSLEIEPGTRDAVFAREPKLRDRFLQVMFRHAQSGGFSGVFTATPVMRDLRGALLDAARGVLGPAVHDVLVTDIMRQDL